MKSAAGCIGVRRRHHQLEVLLVQRGASSRFFPGFHAFPGGVLEEDDGDPRRCALRELFEETGLWPGPRAPGPEPRRALFENRLRLEELLGQFPVEAEFVPAGLRITPEYSLIRFAAQFFLVELDGDPSPWPGELTEAAWWPVPEALEAWRSSRIFLAAPTSAALLHLDRLGPEQAARHMQEEGPGNGVEGPEIPICPGFGYVALETETLPPARHTLAPLVGCQRLLVVDPGSADPAELSRLDEAIARRNLPVQEVLLTHHHPDHVGGLEWARQRGYPVVAHPATARQLNLSLSREVQDGDTFDLGGDCRLQALHTPGHASGHLALWHAQRRILLAGDLVSGISTIIVAGPDGHMGQYLASLNRVIDLEPRLVVASHGPPYGPDSSLLKATRDHRLAREATILDALSDSPQSPDAILARAYADTPPSLWPLAGLALDSHLAWLAEQGRARQTAAGWSAITPRRG